MSTILDIRTEGDYLKLSTQSSIAETITCFEYIKPNYAEISALCQQTVGILSRAVCSGTLKGRELELLQNLGLSLYDQLLTPQIKENLRQAAGQPLILKIDEKLVSIPWELLYDGNNFLSMGVILGRNVYTHLAGVRTCDNTVTLPLKVLIIADPRSNMESAYDEGVSIMNMLKQMSGQVLVDFQTAITPQKLKLCIRNYDIVHYAGHAEYNESSPSESGWLLHQGVLSAEDIVSMGNANKPMPALVFANACQSGKTLWENAEVGSRQVFSLANAFLLSGVKHYIGTSLDVLDKDSVHFSIAFYKSLLAGDSVAASVRQARISTYAKFSEGSAIWASYLLYGDPVTCYITKPIKAKTFEAVEDLGKKKPYVSKYLLCGLFIIIAIVAIKIFATRTTKNISHKSPVSIHPAKPSTKKIRKANIQIKVNHILAISSSPPGAHVKLNGKYVGETPLKKSLPIGKYRLIFEKYGYMPLDKSAKLLKNGLNFKVLLKPYKNWSMFRRDNAHSACCSERKFDIPLKLKWKLSTLGRVRASAAFVGNTLYIGSEDKYLYAINSENGTVLWKCLTSGHVYSTPAIVGNTVYIASDDGFVYAVSAKNGETLWKQYLHSSTTSSPSICFDSEELYIGTNSGRIYVIDPVNKWKPHYFTTMGNIASSAAIYDKKAYIGSGDGSLYSIHNEELKKIYQTYGSISASPLIKDGVIYVCSEDEHLYSLSKDGRLLWQYGSMSGELASPPAMAHQNLFFGTVGGSVCSLRADDGKVNWQVRLEGAVFTSPLVSNNYVFVCCDDGNLYLLRVGDGAVAWKYYIGAKVRSSPIFANGILYFGADNNYIYALGS